MNNRAFLVVLVAVVISGGSLGGAFAGGIAVGKTQRSGGETVVTGNQSANDSDQATTGEVIPNDFSELRQRIQSGEVSPEDIAELRQQFQSSRGRGMGLGAIAGGGRLTGTIASVDGTTLTVDTAQGPLQTEIETETTIQMFIKGDLGDLETGTRVIVVGSRDGDGLVTAGSILIAPEGLDGLFGGAGTGGRLQGRDRP